MANKTIAYSNKGGFWKTRYTFFSSCYAFVDRCLISFNKSFTTITTPIENGETITLEPVWKHDENDARTSFYGTQGGSGIAVTFNTSPSQNKLYKAFSLESTNNITGLNTFSVNNSSVPTQVKTITAGALQERGGIMYGHIGRETVASGANVKLVGRIISQSDDGDSYVMQFAEGGKSNLSNNGTASTKFFIRNAFPGAATEYFTTDMTVSVGLPASYGAFSSALTLALDDETNTTGNEIFLSGGLIDIPVDVDAEGNPTDGPFFLYSVSPEAINAEDPKGQTADAVILLGFDPYELYALNVEYSPTDLDHSK